MIPGWSGRGDRGCAGAAPRARPGWGQGLRVLVPLGTRDVAVLGWGCTFSSLTSAWETCPHGVTCVVACCRLSPSSIRPPEPRAGSAWGWGMCGVWVGTQGMELALPTVPWMAGGTVGLSLSSER